MEGNETGKSLFPTSLEVAVLTSGRAEPRSDSTTERCLLNIWPKTLSSESTVRRRN